MKANWTLALLLAAAPVAITLAQSPQEPKPVPKDSIEIATQGCLKGRAFYATGGREGGNDPRRQEAEVQRGPDVTGMTFRLAGPKPVMEEVKKHNGKLVEVVGIVRKAALADNAQTGKRIGNTRVIIGSPQGSGTMTGRGGVPIGNVTVMDISALRWVANSCPVH